MKLKTAVILIVTLFGFLHSVVSQCSVNIRNNIPTRDPVYIRNTGSGYQLWAPDGPALISAAGASHLLTCSGSGNSLLLTGAVSNTAVCVSGTNFAVGGTTASSSTLECSNTITGDTTNTGSGCTGGGTILYIGFQTGSHGFVTYIQSCYNMNTGSTIYTRHNLPGRAINHAVIESSRPGFKVAGTAPHVSPATSYTQASQLARLTVLLGSAAQAAQFIYSNSYMARGHLSPDADGIFRSWQFSTYFYTNVAPQWQVFNAGNWLRVENAARQKAGNSQDDLLIFSGTHGILTLPHVNGNQVEITLEAGGNIEVPKWFWKVIKSTATNSAIVLVGLNNPFATSLPANERLCTDICGSHGWAQSQFSNFAQGYTYCCEVNAFRNVVPRVPAEAAAANVLSF